MQSNSQHFVVSCLLTESKLRLKLCSLDYNYNTIKIYAIHAHYALCVRLNILLTKYEIVLPFNMI